MADSQKHTEKIKMKWSRAEVAEIYGICTLTFMGWLDERGYKLRPRKAINVKEFEEIKALFGDPRAYVTAERAQLQPNKNKN